MTDPKPPWPNCVLYFEERPVIVEISERGEQTGGPGSGYPSTALVKGFGGASSISFRAPDEGDDPPEGTAAVVDMSSYHVKNEDTGRAFHVNVEAFLTPHEIRQLRDFLTFYLAQFD